MWMKLWFTMFALAGVLGLQAEVDFSKVSIIGTTDKDAVSYRTGDKMVFTVKVNWNGQAPDAEYKLVCSRTGDDGQTVNYPEEKVTDHPVVFTTSLDRPGFVRLRAVLTGPDGKTVKYKDAKQKIMEVCFDGGAGAEIEKITAAAPEPEDFDAFWTKQKARLPEVPVKAELEKCDTSNSKLNIYRVKVDCPGPRPVTGYLTVPVGAAAKSLPAVVTYQGYGVRMQKAPAGGNDKQISFLVNAHGSELDQSEQYYKDLSEKIKSNGKSYGLDPEQNQNPETAYFNGMVLRVMRSLEYVKTLPEWNGKLTAFGSSQGGLQSIWAAALDPDVTECTSNITWSCNLAGGKLDGRLKGWGPEWTPALGYYDAVNHARRIKCPVTIPRAGLGDYTCPPSGLAVLYNNLKCPKKISWRQGSTHGYVPPEPESFIRESR